MAGTVQDGRTTAFVPSAEVVDDLLDRRDGARRRQHRFLLHADDAFDQHVAGAIGLLCVDDRDIRPERRHRGERPRR